MLLSSPHLTSPHLTSPHLASSPHLTSSSPHLSSRLSSSHLTSHLLTSPRLSTSSPAGVASPHLPLPRALRATLQYGHALLRYSQQRRGSNQQNLTLTHRLRRPSLARIAPAHRSRPSLAPVAPIASPNAPPPSCASTRRQACVWARSGAGARARPAQTTRAIHQAAAAREAAAAAEAAAEEATGRRRGRMALVAMGRTAMERIARERARRQSSRCTQRWS